MLSSFAYYFALVSSTAFKMPVRITVVPASTNAGKETIRALLNCQEKPLVHGIYRDTSKALSEFTENPNFEASQGDVASGTGLDFSNSNAVLYIPPPTYDGTDQTEFAVKTANNVKNALKAGSVKKLLIHSAMGAQHDHGIVRISAPLEFLWRYLLIGFRGF